MKRFFTILALIFAISVLAKAETSPDVAAGWRGRIGDGWDFVIADQQPTADGAAVFFRYSSRNLGTDSRLNGSMEMSLRNGKLRAIVWSELQFIYGIEGVVTPDGRLAYGTARLPTQWGASDEPIRWWATIDTATPRVPSTLDLNRVTVGELEATGLSPRSARTVVQGSLWAPYKTVAEALAAPGLTDAERAVLRKGKIVR